MRGHMYTNLVSTNGTGTMFMTEVGGTFCTACGGNHSLGIVPTFLDICTDMKKTTEARLRELPPAGPAEADRTRDHATYPPSFISCRQCKILKFMHACERVTTAADLGGGRRPWRVKMNELGERRHREDDGDADCE